MTDTKNELKLGLAMWIESLYNTCNKPYENQHVKEIMQRNNLTKTDLENIIPAKWQNNILCTSQA